MKIRLGSCAKLQIGPIPSGNQTWTISVASDPNGFGLFAINTKALKILFGLDGDLIIQAARRQRNGGRASLILDTIFDGPLKLLGENSGCVSHISMC